MISALEICEHAFAQALQARSPQPVGFAMVDKRRRDGEVSATATVVEDVEQATVLGPRFVGAVSREVVCVTL